ncbi:DNA-processing protein DprA [Leptospira fluminis]|nr:DNA-processing protein DprA [Leptospira fluminis]
MRKKDSALCMDSLSLSSPKLQSLIVRSGILSRFSSEREAIAELEKILPASIRSLVKEEAKRYRSSFEKLGGFVLSYYDSDYPKLLREIYDPPPNLFCIGDRNVLGQNLAAVVGTRSISPITRLACKSVPLLLSEIGYSGLVSGLALGADALVMDAALNAGMFVLGVLGTGPEKEYPAENGALFRRMKSAANALIVTEYPPDFPVRKYAFPKRNRIITGICPTLFLMEAPAKSGAISSASSALSQNREIYVFDHPAQTRNEGGKKLISEGANLLLFPRLSDRSGKFFHKDDLLPEDFRDLPETLARLGKETLDDNWIHLGNGYLTSEG